MGEFENDGDETTRIQVNPQTDGAHGFTVGVCHEYGGGTVQIWCESPSIGFNLVMTHEEASAFAKALEDHAKVACEFEETP